MNAAAQYAEEIREGRPIEFEGLLFYPLQVRHFALYQNAKPAMELMLGTLPPRFARYTWIEALDALDREATDKQIRTGYLGSILLLLDAALKTEAVRNPQAMIAARDRDGRFAALVVQQQEEQPVALTRDHFPQIRDILAAQNGYTVPDENWNPELVRAQQYLREQASVGGNGGSLEDAVSALAAATGHRSGEIWGWTIREFEQMQSAVDRRLRFQIYTAAELSGQVKFTKGNPYPTWIWANRGELPRGFTSLKELDEGAHGLLATPTN